MLETQYESSVAAPELFFQDSFGILKIGEPARVEIEVREPMASYVAERRWHDSQNINRQEDKIIMSMKVRINEELARWVLGLGPLAEVIQPMALRTMVQDMAGEIERTYFQKKAA